MESRVLWFTVTCILCGNAFGKSGLPKVSASTNDTSILDVKVNETKDTQTERLIKMQSKLIADASKNDWAGPGILQEFPIILNGFRREDCSRYCIRPRKLGTNENDPMENFSLSLAFVGNSNKEENVSLEGSPSLKILKYTVNGESKDVTNLSNCQIYISFDCNANTGKNLVNRQNKFESNLERGRRESSQYVETPLNLFRRVTLKFPKELVRRTDLNGYTETEFYVDADVTEIVINISGSLKRAVLAIPTNRTMLEPGQTPGITMSLAHTYDAKGVAVGARNPSQGGWYVKLQGLPDSKYDLNVVAYFNASEEDNTWNGITTDDIKPISENTSTLKLHDNTAADRIHSILLMNSLMIKKPKSMFERSAEITGATNTNNEATADNLTDESLLSHEFPTMEDIIDSSSLINQTLKSYGGLKIPRNAPYKEVSGEMLAQQQQQTIQTRSSEVASLNENIDANVKILATNNLSVLMTSSDSIQQHSEKLASASKDIILGRQKVPIEVNANSNLLATPGTIHRVVFDVTNNCGLLVRYAMRARSSPFRINYVDPPTNIWLNPGQTGQVTVSIVVPLRGFNQDTVNKLTLSIEGTEIPEKTVYIYVRETFANRNIDDTRPTIEYSFNNNCAGKLNKDRCEKTLWSMEITVQDPDSGLKSVTSTPNAIYPRTEFISGTKSPVTFYYVSTCCSTAATITAIDVLNNQYTRKIDVTEWDNLSQGEVAAIVVGALFLLLLLILFIVAIVLCVRRKSGHDLPYTQRYGSRPPARSERTSF